MSISRYSYSGVLGPWKNASTSFAPRCMNWRTNYRTLSTILGSQRASQQQLHRCSSSPVQQSSRSLHSTAPRLKDVRPRSMEKSDGYVTLMNLKKNGPNISRFGEFWLRDNCQCHECIHPDTSQRSVDTFSIPKDVTADNANFDVESVQIDWSDGHAGTYPVSWLIGHSNELGKRTTAASGPRMTFRKTKQYPVGNPQAKYPRVSHNSIMESDQGLLDWVDNIYKWGFCFIHDVPVDPESTKALIEKIAFIRHTHYGGFWDFTADLSFKDTAYTNEFLGAHTDNTYFTDPARLQLFHLLSHTDGHGGASLLVDGFKAAEILHKENPKHCKALSLHPQPFHSSGNEDTCIQPLQQYPVICVHPEFNNRVYQVRWNNYDRAAKNDWGRLQQDEWYEAARHYNEIIQRPEMQLWDQLQPGTALIFDNWRMLHGRSQFTGKRRMCGGYVNNDDYLSRYRLLRFGRQKVLENLGNSANVKDNPSYYF